MSERSHDAILATERSRRCRAGGALLALLAVIAVAGHYVGVFDGARLAQGVPALLELMGNMLPPDFTGWRDWIAPLIDTLAMSVAGTAIAVIASVPLAFCAARNTTPSTALYHGTRNLLNFLRTVPELIMGILFVAAVGFGPLAGVLAVGLHSIGMVGKFFAETVEHADPAPIEAVRATGAGPAQVIWHGVLPQVLPRFLDVSVYRWEYNFRASTVMGLVGAGGIGFELIGSLRILAYREVFAILLVILATVIVVDGIGSALRRRIQ
ncbi:phosphonate ABC transporter, permease protein PhnE [Arhodomonas aquaeolei]|uniref:phosphonate ABC transporter, permease protein PhnE n=1 Tax=Arhodomonas aquaeolei TaxID=2369 RepID=UPI00216833A5|nr:phosphonate ABC transporter, permease protein PhnE [Arhodomonas aquaeolei]MCS4503138.1 phosphonate ABC transporter, permease protein PhnE [Arhodomonas aquaeolei]